MVYIAVLAAQVFRGFSSQTSTNACGHICKYVDQKGLASILTSIDTVSRFLTRVESEDHIVEKAHKGSTLALKPGEDITRSPKQGY